MDTHKNKVSGKIPPLGPKQIQLDEWDEWNELGDELEGAVQAGIKIMDAAPDSIDTPKEVTHTERLNSLKQTSQGRE